MQRLLTALLFMGSSVYAQSLLNQHVDSLLNLHPKFSGVVLLARDGKMECAVARGLRSYASRQPLLVSDVFELASVSKQFTATIIMMLREQGALSFDDPVEKYISIPYPGITVRHLLQHSSGLPDYQDLMNKYWDKTKQAGNEDILEYLRRYAPPAHFTPGEKYEYSNTGYVLLASIAEKASGQDFSAMLRGRIFRKAGMNRTDIRLPAQRAEMPDFAIGHTFIPEKGRFAQADSFPDADYTFWLGRREGPGRISSTAKDLLAWENAINKGILVPKAILDTAWTPGRLNNGTFSDYGFGWEIDQNPVYGKLIWHGGDNPGYRTWLIRQQDSRKVIILLANNDYSGLDEIIRDLRSIHFGF